MKPMHLEFTLIKMDVKRIVITCLLFPLLGTLMSSWSEAFSSQCLSELFSRLFGAVTISNWMYWLMICFGYVVLLQIVWKKRDKYFEHKLFILLRDTTSYTMARLLAGVLFTLVYVLSVFLIAGGFGLFVSHMAFSFDRSLVLMFVGIAVNLYWHASVWMLLNVYATHHLANVVILALFFVGVKMPTPFIPLYYSMADLVRSSSMFWSALMVELLSIVAFGYWTIKRVKNADYM
ncbi:MULTISPECIES: hypothetical protein [Geobacillus]|uniref:ABC-2 transporter family protein n=7 Tax=Geobacillus TaxID=129337 RepID=Q5L3A5_GEOKA|nr:MULTISPECIES: hypothetical protein [Geobacillus]ASS87688.1 hypothetical protein GLN3_11920 [Geobacillus lituanicus]RAN30537.1 hypothetical protein VC88_02410 [Geobacillus sp. A8]AEV17704.1 hypothetical protein GTCCBUS3UF5_3780 [Geobacillus thermoleovorans CCB_US3_UF5]AST00721.1 hypothetical protein GT3921_17985 [Geobacillus thermocatenulatus]AUI36600.1 hypothetical protein CWI35_08755 [[Bacillus] caldolyticus]